MSCLGSYDPEDPPEELEYTVGSGVGIETLTEAIALGKMLDYPGGVQTIYVAGTFEIDAIYPYTFGEAIGGDTSFIILDNNATIDITTTKSFNITFTAIHACYLMWNTIRVRTGAKIFVDKSEIRDGLRAFTLDPGSIAIFRRDLFLNNLYGIYYSEGIHSHTQSVVDLCTFEGDQGGLVSQHTAFNNTAYAGIYIRNSPNVYTIHKNIFDGVQNGIIADNSCIFATPNVATQLTNNNIFVDIQPAGQFDGLAFGNGIYLNSGCPPSVSSNIGWTGHQVGLTLGYDGIPSSSITSNFQNCRRGIYVDNGRVNIWDNHMSECDTAIIIRNTPWTQVQHKSRIYGNTIEDSKKLGIGLLSNGVYYRADVFDNVIELNATTASKGIWVNGNNLPQYVTISGNEINLHTQGLGIEVELAPDVKIVDENEFTVTGTGYNYKCVSMHSQSHRGIVTDNYFDGLDQGSYTSSTPNKIGLEISDCQFTMADCNLFDNVGTSMAHKYSSEYALIRSNQFISGTDGYSLGSQATGGSYIGEQSQGMIGNENTWPTSTSGDYYPSYDARSFHTSSQEEEFNKFWVDEEDDQFFNSEFWPDKIQSAGSNWFEDDPLVIMVGVNNCSAHFRPEPSEELTGIEQRLVGDSLELGTEYFNWKAAWAFLHQIELHPDLKNDEDVENWWDGMNSSPMGELYILESDVVGGMNIPEALNDVLDEMGERCDEFLEDIRILDSILVEDGVLDSLDALSYAILADSLDQIFTELTEIRGSYLDTIEVRLDYLYSRLDSIEPVEHFDEQLQAVLKIWVSNALHPEDTLTAGQVSALDEWGQSCRFADGPAVVMARAMLRMRGLNQPTGDHPDCLEELNGEAEVRNMGEAGMWRLVPTVTNGSSRLERIQPLRTDTEVILEVFDQNGHCHYKGVCNGNKQWLDFAGMPGGGYFIRISERERPPVIIRMVKI